MILFVAWLMENCEGLITIFCLLCPILPFLFGNTHIFILSISCLDNTNRSSLSSCFQVITQRFFQINISSKIHHPFQTSQGLCIIRKMSCPFSLPWSLSSHLSLLSCHSSPIFSCLSLEWSPKQVPLLSVKTLPRMEFWVWEHVSAWPVSSCSLGYSLCIFSSMKLFLAFRYEVGTPHFLLLNFIFNIQTVDTDDILKSLCLVYFLNVYFHYIPHW